ncbi:enoyl-CoA hydratase/isomerase family protein [Klenkia taihuensis]|uniref:Enoyl-CoA hydratase n=1 Tax=Klenkia taihuensis TaxID=1225127 RepID=A0A1I1QFT5_9ACTN|nr:enoyl-CoA hydratase/isomerase family protein [Klenkia taihuensis]GHE07838.1 enoyl-CoA hydratase [Klenkia taihuensis]SFD20961.1 Enoyl-CoA hydratase [Klenkia taihuensis]
MSGDPARGWVTTSQAGPVLTVLLDRADQLNAQVPATWTTLAEVGAALPADVRVVVVRGAGRAFSAGLDRSLFAADPGTPGGLGELAGLGPEGAQERIRGYQAGFRWLRQPGIVSVAVVQGHAIGAGAQLALACDLRVCAEEATFALPEATLGLVPDLTGTSTLVQAVGYSRALEMCLTGRRVGAAEASAAGLANVVVPAAQLDAAVDQLVTAVLGPDVDASRETAALVRRAAAVDDDGQDAAERAAQVRRLHALAVRAAEQASAARG